MEKNWTKQSKQQEKQTNVLMDILLLEGLPLENDGPNWYRKWYKNVDNLRKITTDNFSF